jgi:PPOX class probable F420-dependent enzyme
MAAIPEKYLDLLQQKKAFASLATTMPDGSPQVTPVWFDYQDGLIRVNTAKGRVKARNMKTGVPVALAIMDPDNPYRYLQIRGRVGRVIEAGADQHIDSLAKKYLGKDTYPFAQPGEMRVMYEIEPASASGMGCGRRRRKHQHFFSRSSRAAAASLSSSRTRPSHNCFSCASRACSDRFRQSSAAFSHFSTRLSDIRRQCGLGRRSSTMRGAAMKLGRAMAQGCQCYFRPM